MGSYDSILGMQVLGLSIDKPFLHIAFIEKRKGFYLKSFPLSELENVKRLYIPPFKGKISSAFPAKNLLMRTLEVPVTSAKHLEQAIAFQSDAASHFNEEDLFSVPRIVKQHKEKTEVQLFTTDKKTLKDHLNFLEKINLDPDCVTPSPLALTEYIKWKFPDLQSAFLVHLGLEEWTCVCIQDGEMKKFHSILGEREGVLNPHFSSAIDSMKQELSRAIYSFFHLYGAMPLVLTGEIDAFGQIEEYLKTDLNELIDPNIVYEIPKEEQKYAIPIGLAVGYHAKTVQFRKNEFFPKKMWKKAGLYALCLTAASFLMGGGCLALGNHIVKLQTEKMVSFLQETLNEQDPPLAKKIFTGNQDEILTRWSKAIRVHSKEYAYAASFPKVSQILSWIYQHPVILEAKQTETPIEIKAVRYQLLQYPKMSAPQDRYQGKVEIEFSTKSPLNARKFHQSLHKGEGWVNPEQDIQWEPSENLYRAAFYLKKELSDAS